MAKTMLLALLLAVTGTAHAEPTPTNVPAATAARMRPVAGGFLGALIGGAAGLVYAQYSINEREANSGERLHGPDAAFTTLGFGFGGALVGAVVGYVLARPAAGPPPAAAAAWSELGRPTTRLASTPRDGRVVPMLQLSF
jgi:hypothetical protein